MSGAKTNRKTATKQQKMVRAKFSHVNTQGYGADIVGVIDGNSNLKGQKVRIVMSKEDVDAFIKGLDEGKEIKEALQVLSEECKERNEKHKVRSKKDMKWNDQQVGEK